MHFKPPFLLLALSILAWQAPAMASVPEKMSGSSGMADMLAAAIIALILALVVAFAFYVRKQKKNNALLLAQMYGTILDGRLRILIINLQDSMEFLCVDVDKNELDSFSLDGFWRLDDEKLREDLVELARKNGLGILERRNLQRGFDYLYQAIGLMSRLPVKTVDIVWLLPQTDRQELQNLLVESIHSFEAVKRQIML